MCACCVGLLCTARAAGCATSARWRTSVWPAWCTAPGDAPQAQPCSTRVRAVHLHSVIYTRMVVDGGRRRRGTDKQGGCGAAGAQLAWTCPSRAGLGAHAAQGPRTYLRFYNIYIYVYVYVCTSMSAPRPRVCAGCGRQLAWTWPGRGAVRAQHAVHCSRGPARTLGFKIYIYIYQQVCRLWCVHFIRTSDMARFGNCPYSAVPVLLGRRPARAGSPQPLS